MSSASSRHPVSLALSCLLVAACSSEETSRQTGTGGAAGLSGAGGANFCREAEACVPSCFGPTFESQTPICDATGAFTACPSGTVPVSSCPDNACVHVSSTCCDDTTGAFAQAVCGPDGVLEPCETGRRLSPSGCIPSGLGVSSCGPLFGQSCEQPDQQCHFGTTSCICRASDGGQPLWDCASDLLI